MTKIFDVEESITDCWTVIDDINLMADSLDDINLDEYQRKQINKMLRSVAVVYDMKFERLMKRFSKSVEKKPSFEEVNNNSNTGV